MIMKLLNNIALSIAGSVVIIGICQIAKLEQWYLVSGCACWGFYAGSKTDKP